MTTTYRIPDGAKALDALLQIRDDDLTHTCQFVDPRTDDECGADGVIFRVALIAAPPEPPSEKIEVCPAHVSAVMAEPMTSEPLWAVGLVQDLA